MTEPTTLQDIILEGLERNNEFDVGAMTRYKTQRLKANSIQYGGDHYKNMGIEPWEVCDTWPLEQQIGAHRHGVLKYIMRFGNKDERLKEAQKVLHYAQKLVEVLEQAEKQ